MKSLILGCGLTAAALLFLVFEILQLQRRRMNLKIRVCVTGTRGKSSVVRLLTAALREAGLRVVAKTTGSLPCLLLPDGSEQVIRRLGPPTILEQKRLLKEAHRRQAEVLVAEVMSISPENQYVESQRILKANLCLITNVRIDHQDTLGKSREQVASSLALSTPPGGTVLCPDRECLPPLVQAADELGAQLVRVPTVLPSFVQRALGQLPYHEFEENMSLALSASSRLGVPPDTALRGMLKVKADSGALKAWLLSSVARPLIVVSAFAANEPTSTLRVFAALGFRLAEPHPEALPGPVTGLLNLRRDRGERTQQWIEALQQENLGFLGFFDRLLLIGPHAYAVQRALNSPKVLVCGGSRLEQRVMDILEKSGGTLIGFGNFYGAGMRLVRLWERRGTAYEL